MKKIIFFMIPLLFLTSCSLAEVKTKIFGWNEEEVSSETSTGEKVDVDKSEVPDNKTNSGEISKDNSWSSVEDQTNSTGGMIKTNPFDNKTNTGTSSLTWTLMWSWVEVSTNDSFQNETSLNPIIWVWEVNTNSWNNIEQQINQPSPIVTQEEKPNNTGWMSALDRLKNIKN